VLATLKKSPLPQQANYAACKACLGGRSSRPLCHGTRLALTGEGGVVACVVLYRGNPLLTFYPGGVVRYQTGVRPSRLDPVRRDALRHRLAYYGPAPMSGDDGWAVDGKGFAPNFYRYDAGPVRLYFTKRSEAHMFLLTDTAGETLRCKSVRPDDAQAETLFAALVRDGFPGIVDYLQEVPECHFDA
jgi:hypothetical protein